MLLNYLMSKKGISRYRLGVIAGISHSTLNDLCNGKTKLERCSALQNKFYQIYIEARYDLILKSIFDRITC